MQATGDTVVVGVQQMAFVSGEISAEVVLLNTHSGESLSVPIAADMIVALLALISGSSLEEAVDDAVLETAKTVAPIQAVSQKPLPRVWPPVPLSEDVDEFDSVDNQQI